MANQGPSWLSAAVEGLVDAAILRRMLSELGISLGPVFVTNGKDRLRRHIRGYNIAAGHSGWIVLVDLNTEAECAPRLRGEWLPAPSRFMHFRVAVRKVESWLLADRESMARFLGVSVSRIPAVPDLLENPKRTIVDLAQGSRRSELRRDLIPRPGSGREIGPGYTSRIIEFALRHWRPRVAETNSESLRRCLRALRRGETRPGPSTAGS